MDYNQIVINDLLPLCERLFRMVDRFSDYYKIEDLKLSVDDSDLSDLGSYISTGTTCEFRIDVNYKLVGEEEYRYFYFTVPRMINGVFIINGKYKMINRRLGYDDTCRKVGNYLRIRPGFSYNIDLGVFTYKYDESEDQYTLEDLQKDWPEELKLSDHAAYKLKIKLNLDYLPKEINKEILEGMCKMKENPDDMIDCRIISIESNIIKSIRNEMLTIVKQMNYNFYKTGSISPGPLQHNIDAVFSGQSDAGNTLISSANVNPISFDSASEKIIIDNPEPKKLVPGHYDATMADLIDPVVTPDSSNVNRINYLTKSAGVVNGKIAIKCYDSKFNAVEIPYLQYCASTVLQSSEVESYEDKIVPTKDLYQVLVNRNKSQSPTYDFIEPSPDDRLCIETRMIPMLNMIDSVRGAMGAKMVSQAVPLSNPDTPRVQSGHEGDFDASTTSIKFESTKEGQVIKSDNNSVIIMVEGIPKEYKVPQPAVGIYNITAVFTPKVKVGDTVKTGDPIITQDISKTGMHRLGLNALAALRPYRGLNYEDGIVISESFAKRLNHYSILDLNLYVKDNQTINSLLPIGTRVTSRDILVTCISSFVSEQNAELIRIMTPDDKSIIRYNNLVVPNTVVEGYVTDVKIYYNDYVEEKYNKVVNELNKSSVQILEDFKRKKIVLPDAVPSEYRAQIPEGGDYEGFAALIRYRLLVKNPAKVGSKLTNRYGSKGMVAKILPDSEMDYLPDGRKIDIILNSDAVIARKNIGQIPEVALGNIADVLATRVKSIDSIKEIKELLAKYKLTQYSSMSDEELKSYIASGKPFNYVTGCFSRISISEVLNWMKELGLEEGTTLIDGVTKRPIRQKIIVGDMYIMKLYKLPEYDNKVHTTDSYEDPILGQGLTREGGGQNQGILETYSLMASDLDPLIGATRKSHEFQDASSMLINLRLAGMNIHIKPNKDRE